MPINRAIEFECCHCTNVFTHADAGGERLIRAEPSHINPALAVRHYGKVCAHCVVTLQEERKPRPIKKTKRRASRAKAS